MNRTALINQVLVFVCLTFISTYALNFFGFNQFGAIGGNPHPGWQNFLGIQMLIPATAAFLTAKLFKLRFSTQSNWLWLLFLGIAAIAIISIFYDPVLFSPVQNGTKIPVTFSLVAIQALSVIGTLYLILANIKKKWRQALTKDSLALSGKIGDYIIPLGLLLIWIILSAAFNYVLQLGSTGSTFNPRMFLLTMATALLIAPLTNWVYFFGEEYGWRVFLQERIFKLWGNFTGSLVVGIIWGLWHAPVIMFGYNYPQYPILGVVLMTVFTILVGFIYSFAVLKTKSIWSAVWLHIVTNNGISLSYVYISQPDNPILSFGIGVYGLILLAIIVGILIRKSRLFQLS